MKVRMLETFQSVNSVAILAEEGISVSILERDETYIVDVTLGSWLIDNRKAVEIPTNQYMQAITKEQVESIESETELVEEPKPRKRGRK